jgi:hypothetical protein
MGGKRVFISQMKLSSSSLLLLILLFQLNLPINCIASSKYCLELNISHILNITSHIPKYFENQGIKYKRLPASDSGCQNLRQYFDEAIQFIGKFN